MVLSLTGTCFPFRPSLLPWLYNYLRLGSAVIAQLLNRGLNKRSWFPSHTKGGGRWAVQGGGAALCLKVLGGAGSFQTPPWVWSSSSTIPPPPHSRQQMEEGTKAGQICAKTALSESPGSCHVTDCSLIIGQGDLPQGRLGNVVFSPR